MVSFDFSLSSRRVVCLSASLVKDKKIRTTLSTIREMARRERGGWLCKRIFRKGLKLTTLMFFFFQSSPLSTEKKSVLLEIGGVVLVVDSISVHDLEWIFLSEPFLT